MNNRSPEQCHTFQEIIHHGPGWQSALNAVKSGADKLMALWASGKVAEVIFIGCGSTYYLSRSAARIFQGKVGVSGQALPSSDLLLFPSHLLNGQARRLLIAVSRSGTTTETVKAVEMFKARTGQPAIGVTCYAQSVLVERVDRAIVATEGREESIAQTRSFSSMLVATNALGILLSGAPAESIYANLIAESESNLKQHASLAEQLGRDNTFERFFFLGSGLNYGLACEAMLKMKEMSLSYAEAFHFMEFRHGPMAMVNDRTLVVGLISDAALPFETAVLRDMRDLGARTLVITPRPLPPDVADYQMIIQDHYDDLDRGPLYLPMLQLLAFYRAIRNGLNPDKPLNLTSVVELKDDHFNIV